jgi:intracellular sulfur oxidation DsrE/DsrF family protein
MSWVRNNFERVSLETESLKGKLPMHPSKSITSVCFAVIALSCAGGFPSVQGADFANAAPVNGKVKYRAVFQVSDSDPKTWSQALANIKNTQKELGSDRTDIELVVYGNGIGMLTFDSEVADKLTEIISGGVKVFACENTMQGHKLTKDDMLPRIDYVKAGVVKLITRQAEGYAYIKP